MSHLDQAFALDALYDGRCFVVEVRGLGRIPELAVRELEAEDFCRCIGLLEGLIASVNNPYI